MKPVTTAPKCTPTSAATTCHGMPEAVFRHQNSRNTLCSKRQQLLKAQQWVAGEASVDAAVAQRCARLHVPDKRGERDALIAATALVHGMTVVTRNVADFQPTGVAVLNPWESSH